MEELKACPFCGQKPKMKSGLNSEGKPFFQVTHDCMNLLSQIKTFCYGTEAEAATAWNRRAAPENKPLTLEQLRRMDGEPVWVVMIGEAKPPICEIVVECYKDGIKMASAEYTDDYGAFDLYGKTWLAYVRRPEDTP